MVATMTFLKLFLSTMIKTIKIQNVFLSHYSSKIFYRTWVMYSKENLMKTFFKVFLIFFETSMGPIKFSVTYLVGPPNCTSTHVIDLKVEVYKIKGEVAYKR
jgi:hypothetical protein